MEEFFYTFNELYDAGKQIIFTSDQPPWELVDTPERLVSRLGQGLTVGIQPPDYETRVAILKNLSFLSGLKLTREVKEVLDVIAQNITTNVRDLNGAFTRVTATSRLLDLPLDKELAKKVLADHSIDV